MSGIEEFWRAEREAHRRESARRQPEPKSDPNERVRIIELDTLTGERRTLPNYDTAPDYTWARHEAERSIAWRRANITSRYDYRIERAEA